MANAKGTLYWIPALVLTSGFAVASIEAQNLPGCCGEEGCSVLNSPLIGCYPNQADDGRCASNPDGYYGFCCDVGGSACPA